MGFQLIPRDINSPQNGKTKFNENDEEALTKWMLRNLLLFYHANNEYTAIEKELIKTYNPPLNLQGNSNKINWEFRKGLSALRSRTTQNVVYHNQEKPDITFSNSKHTYCPNCGISLVITDDLEKEEYVKCLTCGSILLNPVYAQIKKNKERRQWKVILIIIGIAFLFNLLARLGSTSNGNNIGNKNGPTQTEAMAGVRTYLKHYYLKDPDSYHGISWEAFGSYNKQNNTYFPLHKYRAKNSFGGYVVEEKMFVLDSDGNVIKVIDDINDLINDN